MVFSSPLFLFFFFPVFFLLYYVLPARVRIPWLLAGSLFFYAWGEPVYVLLMAGEILMIWLCGLGIQSARDRGKTRQAALFLALGVLLALGALLYFKYANLFVTEYRRLAGIRKRWKSIALPIGISFYTFQSLSYLIDVWKGRVQARRNLLRLGAYISMFPQLIAGPIVRYGQIAEDLDLLADGRKKPSLQEVSAGMARMILGLSKKVLLANQIASWCDSLWLHKPANLSPGLLWLMAAMYALQIYYDFSGYSDMAIGMGRMLGFRFSENFNYPYVALSVRDFWHRWHISLSTWFRDYVYIPLGGNRKGALRTLLNLLIVFALCGFWHGASWNFLLWGLYYGLFLCLERLPFWRRMEKLPKLLRWLLTGAVVLVGWVLFQDIGLDKSLAMIGIMFGAPCTPAFPVVSLFTWKRALVLGCAVVGMFPLLPFLKARTQNLTGVPAALIRGLAAVCLLALLALCTQQLVSNTYNPFIYFRF